MGPPVRRAALLLLALACATGCRATRSLGGDSAAGPDRPEEAGPGRAAFEAAVELGPYADDERVAALAESWPQAVEGALGRLRLVTGLGFPQGADPRVVLAPLGDETRAWEVAAEVVAGRRRPRIRVNVEPLAPGLAAADRVLLEALATAVFDDAARSGRPAAPWVVALARTLASGDLDGRLLDLRRRERRERTDAVVDPSLPRAAEATAAGALLLLQRGGEPAALRRFLLFVRDGDDPGLLLSRHLRDPEGLWVGAAKDALRARLDRLDVASWEVLEAARAAYAEAGRAGLEAALPAEVPWEIAPEAAVLRARAAAQEGDYGATRALLAAIRPEGWARLEDPGAAMALLVVAEAQPGGEPQRARELLALWRRDFPTARRRLGPDLEPVLLLEPGDAAPHPGMDLERARREVEALLADHRGGAAERFLDALGPRGRAPELAEVARRVARAQREPTAEAEEANRERVRAWREEPAEETARPVRDGGTAAARALAEVLPPWPDDLRAEGLRLVVEAGGARSAAQALAEVWRRDPASLPRDLSVLASAVAYGELRIWVEGVLGVDAVDEAAWRDVRLGLDEDWARRHPHLLQGLRHASYAVRRAAFDAVVDAGQVTPEVVAAALADPAVLLRREGARVAGREGYRALAALALGDEAWVVRQAACGAVARAHGEAAVDLLIARLTEDESADVRAAAARALIGVAPGDARALDALVAGLAGEDVRLRQVVASSLDLLPRVRTARALWRALSTEAARASPRTGVLARLLHALTRLGAPDVGYHPAMTRRELARALERLGAWVRRLAGEDE